MPYGGFYRYADIEMTIITRDKFNVLINEYQTGASHLELIPNCTGVSELIDTLSALYNLLDATKDYFRKCPVCDLRQSGQECICLRDDMPKIIAALKPFSANSE